jgi:hypothetical protein
MSKSSKLNWKLFVTPAVATVSDDVPPGETARMWSPTSSILIYGERDAILVDTLTTTAQATALADWVKETHRPRRRGDRMGAPAACRREGIKKGKLARVSY